VTGLDDKGGRILPGMLRMIGEQFGGVIDTVLKLLYRLPCDDWLDTESLISSPDAGGDGLGTELLAGKGHVARVAGDLASEDATTLLDVMPYYEPDAFSAELSGWLAGRDEASVVSQVLEAASGTDPERAVQRVTAITILTLAKPDSALEILRDMASRGPDGSRHVAAGVLVNLGEVPPLYGESTEPWLLVDLLTALSVGNLEEHLSESMLGAIQAHADNLWRCGHPATSDTLEAVAAAVRDSDKALAKRLRKTAYKARAKG
jgi:hypothetical protein